MGKSEPTRVQPEACTIFGLERFVSLPFWVTIAEVVQKLMKMPAENLNNDAVPRVMATAKIDMFFRHEQLRLRLISS